MSEPVRQASPARLAHTEQVPLWLQLQGAAALLMAVRAGRSMTAELEPRTDLEGEAVPASYAAPEVEDVEGMEELQVR